MADRAARHLREHPGQRLAVLAGSGHLMYRQGIPKRLLRRVPAKAAVVINAAEGLPDPALGDYLLFARRVELPPTGLLGVMLDTEQEGVTVKGFGDDSPAKQAGLAEGDRILSVDGAQVGGYADIRYALMDAAVGTELQVEVLRKGLLFGEERLTLPVTLR
jgi:S1-C subfamily serine protease